MTESMLQQGAPDLPEPDSSEPAEPRTYPDWHVLPESFRILAAATPNAVLLETAKQDGSGDKSLLFLHPNVELIAWTAQDLDAILRRIDGYVAGGAYVAGYFQYECGEHFVGLSPRTRGPEPLAWLGVYPAPVEFDHASGTIQGELPQIPPASSSADAAIHIGGLRIPRADYDAALARIHEYLHAGDTYQVNFTDKVVGSTEAEPLAVYRTLLRQQPVPFAAFLNCAAGPILSFSPELFYRTHAGRITVRPMKGTWKRGVDEAGDRAAASLLRNDEKNRSEHVMIVDLLRNDLGRICRYGSVAVDPLFHVERYATLLQMTSTCTGTLADGLSPTQVFAALFPSGSITGAPKRRTMQIIQELEPSPRGVYTGCIGYFGPRGEACFNVAIRTLQLQRGCVVMGVGGGITAGSQSGEEYEECRLKASFLTRRRPPFSLIETMRCEGGIALLPLHMRRLAASARYFGIRYDGPALMQELAMSAASCGEALSRVRLELSEAGVWQIAATALEPVAWGGRLLLAAERTHSQDVFFHHKTTHRELYNRNLRLAYNLGFDEALFENERAQLTECAIGNLFVRIGSRWFTPPLAAGVLPGVERARMLAESPEIAERELRLEDLAAADSIVVSNALRGARPVSSIARPDGSVLWQAGAPGTPRSILSPRG
ncbi:aminodeoxychorismate synthase component I [Granulicella rosea]|uniref:aminodeoxychorismate synthase component I n=1 Tax=Granulicella rosea TaxID=474952 RepID=UPI00115EFBE5|nr:aminodeoxychorismate synthase component I [Granulicella rosea]